MNYIKFTLLIVLVIGFTSCKQRKTENRYIRGSYFDLPKEFNNPIPENLKEQIRKKSSKLIDSILIQTPMLEEVGLGHSYSSEEGLRYLNTYKIDTIGKDFKLLKIEFDLDLNIFRWDTIIYIP